MYTQIRLLPRSRFIPSLKKITTLLLSDFSYWFFKVFAKLIKNKSANSTYLAQFATIVRSQIYLGKFLKITGMLLILESYLLQCIFFSFKMAASSCCYHYVVMSLQMDPGLMTSCCYHYVVRSLQMDPGLMKIKLLVHHRLKTRRNIFTIAKPTCIQ